MTATSKAALNFSPYSEPPDHSRISVGKSQPNLTANTSAPEAGPSSSSSYQAGGAVEALGGNAFGSEGQGDHTRADSFGSGFSSAVQPGDYDTRFGWRCDLMACSAYLLGPFFAIPLLLVETHNDFVRFHAYQSLFLSLALGAIHLVLLWSHFLTRFMFLLDFVIIAYQIRNTYRDADSLRRRFLPFIGELSHNWVQEE